MLLTTVELRFDHETFKIQLYEYDHLYTKVFEFTRMHNLQRYTEQIFDSLYDQFVQLSQTRSPDQPLHSDSRALIRNQKCHQIEQSSFSPKINRVKSQSSPFRMRINLKQIVHKEHSSRHELHEEEQFNFSPKINDYKQAFSPFKERLNLKSLKHKDHSLRHLTYESPSASPPKKNNTIYISKQEPEPVIQQQPMKRVRSKQYILTNSQLDNLVSSQFKRIQNYEIDQKMITTIVNIYRRIVSTQEQRGNLQYSKIGYHLLEQNENQILEKLQKYCISYDLEINEQQFVILILSLLEGYQKGTKIGSLIKLQNLPYHYRKLMK